jgi:hypothetical protein
MYNPDDTHSVDESNTVYTDRARHNDANELQLQLS